jgi:ApaG protein
MQPMEKADKYSINVAVKVDHLAEQSDEADNRFVFAYTITLMNAGSMAAQLLSRHWIITDANHNVQEVRGKGVVGEQPVLQPGQSFEYSSGTVLATQVGTMSGSYRMVAEDGTEFDVPIPQFVLSVPRVLH